MLILTSAVHGVEGFTGSSIQQMFMNELINKDNLENMGVLILHGINPYGFKYKRRVTENNVDLNRNSLSDSNYSDFENIFHGYHIDWGDSDSWKAITPHLKSGDQK